MTDRRLYVITPPRFEPRTFIDDFLTVLDAGPVGCVQLRMKDRPDDDIRQACEALMPPAQERDIAFLVNDRADIAKELGADGVHIGQGDTPCREARNLLGPDAIVGVTCHNSRHLAMEAGEAGADYVAFGSFFPTTTKNTTEKADLATLGWWSAFTTLPSVAIGGITADNCSEILKNGADFLAVCGYVWNNPDASPAEAVGAFSSVLET